MCISLYTYIHVHTYASSDRHLGYPTSRPSKSKPDDFDIFDDGDMFYTRKLPPLQKGRHLGYATSTLSLPLSGAPDPVSEESEGE